MTGLITFGGFIMAENKEMTMEEAFSALKELLAKMESEELSLEENFRLYEEGLSLVKLCSEKLDTIEKKIIVLEEESAE